MQMIMANDSMNVNSDVVQASALRPMLGLMDYVCSDDREIPQRALVGDTKAEGPSISESITSRRIHLVVVIKDASSMVPGAKRKLSDCLENLKIRNNANERWIW